MTEKPAITSIADLLAHAHAIEAEAHERYLDLADQLEVHHNYEVAELFRKMAKVELQHVQKILELAGGTPLPERSPWSYSWSGAEPPETVGLEEIHYLMTPHHALCLALGAERNALTFYESVLETGGDEDMVALARELATEEREHVALVEAWLAKYPEPASDWAEDPDPPAHQE